MTLLWTVRPTAKAQFEVRIGMDRSSSSLSFVTDCRHVRTKQEPIQPIPTFAQLIALIMEVGPPLATLTEACKPTCRPQCAYLLT